MTTFGDQVQQYGGFPVGQGMLATMGFKGKHIYVHGSSGVDRGSGENPMRPLKTLTYAYSKCVDGRGDVVHILNDGSTGATVRDVALVWAKDNCHIIGHCAPGINRRARISPPTTDAADVDAYTPYLTLSASGCIVSNVSWFQGNAEDTKPSVGILLSGSRNHLNNVDVITGAAAHQGDEAGTYNVQVTGSENTFEKCYIGQDTAARSNVANANVRFGAGGQEQATRNVFRDCIFPCYADGAAPVFILAPTAFDTQRWNLFVDCIFLNTGTSTMTAGVSWSDTTGLLFLKDCAFYGCTDVTAADSTLVFAYGCAMGASSVEVGMFKGINIA